MKIIMREYHSINEFAKSIIEEKELNEVFKEKDKDYLSDSKSERKIKFAGSNSLEESLELLQNGWDKHIGRIESSLSKLNLTTKKYTRPEYSMCGYQASVPRYIQGIPTSMVNSKVVMKKQPIVTINKSICYSFGVKIDQIIEESVKALQIVQLIESKGTRVNLNVIFGAYTEKQQIIIKVRIKSVGERLNISKLAFPMVHPSMLRRLMLRKIETYVEIKDKEFADGHGGAMDSKTLLKSINSNEILIPSFIDEVDDFIKNNF